MKRPPRKKQDHLLTPSLLFHSYFVIGLIESVGAFYTYFTILFTHGWRWGDELSGHSALYQKATTAFFVSIILCQIANVMVCRTERESLFKKGIFSNKLILLGIFVELGFVWLLLNNAYLQRIFGTYPLAWHELLLPLPFALLILFVEEVRKKWLRAKEKGIWKKRAF